MKPGDNYRRKQMPLEIQVKCSRFWFHGQGCLGGNFEDMLINQSSSQTWGCAFQGRGDVGERGGHKIYLGGHQVTKKQKRCRRAVKLGQCAGLDCVNVCGGGRQLLLRAPQERTTGQSGRDLDSYVFLVIPSRCTRILGAFIFLFLFFLPIRELGIQSQPGLPG